MPKDYPRSDRISQQIKKEIDNAEKNKCLAIALCIDANVRSHRYLDREARYDARKCSTEAESGRTYG